MTSFTSNFYSKVLKTIFYKLLLFLLDKKIVYVKLKYISNIYVCLQQEKNPLCPNIYYRKSLEYYFLLHRNRV
jgi:hypothetical protein